MGAYTNGVAKPPRTLTELEQRLLLKVTGERRDGYRDHVLFSFALGTGLREHEMVALDVGDVYDDEGRARRRVVLRVFKRSAADPGVQEVVLPDALRAKLEKLRAWKKRQGESLAEDAPLFVSRLGRRLSLRQVRHLFHQWQARAGFDRRLGFHSLRHYADQRIMPARGTTRASHRGACDAEVLLDAA